MEKFLFIIGAQKAATTSLHLSLLKHPDIAGEWLETVVFDDYFYSRDRVKEYTMHCRSFAARYFLIKRPDLLANSQCPPRIFHFSPSAKFVVVLRDPVARAFSALLHYMRAGLLPVKDPNEILYDIFSNDVPRESPVEERIRSYGLYGFSLAQWFEWFDRSQFLILEQEKMSDKELISSKMSEFLEIDSLVVRPERDVFSKQSIKNMTILNYSHFSNRTLRYEYARGFLSLRKPFFFFKAMSMLSNAFEVFLLKNLFRSVDLKLDRDTEKIVRRFYMNDILHLEQMLGRRFDGWQIFE